MDQETFYKDQYDRALDRKNEIDASMTIPIGILTALAGGFFYAFTNFDFDNNLALMITFVVIGLIAVYLLGRPVQFLLRTLTDLQNGIDYVYLIDADELDRYYKNLVTFYNAQPNAIKAKAESEAKKDLDEYILNDLIRCAGINQRNNFSKIAGRYSCYRYMIYAIISLFC